jgi:tRNA1(Val) A37 N6-methylase TrmN6
VTTAAPASLPLSQLTVDAFLGGKIEAVQPAKGHHRSGLEAVLLGACPNPAESRAIVDLGAGAGVAGFSAAVHCPEAEVILIEREIVLVEAARLALARPANAAFAGRVQVVQADIADGAEMQKLGGRADIVLINPPFNPSGSMVASPRGARAAAHVLGETALEDWIGAATILLKPHGRVTLILRPETLGELLGVVGAGFGSLDILPIHPRAGEPAHRVMVTGLKGSRGPLRLMPPVVLHGESGNAFRPEVDAVLRGEKGLADIVRTWHIRR